MGTAKQAIQSKNSVKDFSNEEKKMQPQFVNKPAFTVVGMLIHTKPMTAEIANLWQQFGPRIDEVEPMAEPHVSYGLMDRLINNSAS